MYKYMCILFILTSSNYVFIHIRIYIYIEVLHIHVYIYMYVHVCLQQCCPFLFYAAVIRGAFGTWLDSKVFTESSSSP